MANILVVEDKDPTREFIAEYLGASGHNVVAVSGGREAIDAVAIRGVPIDLVLMDVQMPDLDGFETTATLRSVGLRAPVVFLTALAMHGDRERCLAAGGDGYLSKPFRLKDLDQVLENFLADDPTRRTE